MFNMFCLFLPFTVCLIALPSIALKLNKKKTDSVLIVICISMMLYFSSYFFGESMAFLWVKSLVGCTVLLLLFLWSYQLSKEEMMSFTPHRWHRLLSAHFRDMEWSARDKFLIRADAAIFTGVVLDLARTLLVIYRPDLEIVLSLLALSQACAIYFFYSSAIYIGLIDNPSVNRDTLRAVQQARQSKLRNEFEQLMNEQKPYLKQGITIEDVALMLATNRTYISRMLHDDYHCSFPEYMTEKRLEYSKQFLLEHPHEVQEEVAFQCGFASASAFNKRFREQYGVPPREWLINSKKS